MTTIASKTKIEAKWDAHKKAETTAHLMASYALATHALLDKVAPALKEEFEKTARGQRVQLLKKLGAKDAISLVQAMAELDANLYGSTIEISGDESKAEITYNQCGMWNAMKEIGHLTPEQQQKMGEGFEACLTKQANEFGLKVQTQCAGEAMTITFTK